MIGTGVTKRTRRRRRTGGGIKKTLGNVKQTVKKSVSKVLGVPKSLIKKAKTAAIRKVKRTAINFAVKRLNKLATVGGSVHRRRRSRRGSGFTQSRIKW